MSRRQRLLKKTLIYCSAPVLLGGAWVVTRSLQTDPAYVAGTETEGITRALDRSGTDPTSPLVFTEVTDEAGLAFHHFPFERTRQLPEDMGSGAAWGDFDNDGWPDLFLVNFAVPLGSDPGDGPGDRLYRNLGNGRFAAVSEAAGVDTVHRGLGAAWGDLDADGHLDLLVTSWGENILWRNRGDGTFEEITARAGLAGSGFWTGAAWSDFDRDGDLDLYVCGYTQYDEQPPGTGMGSNGNTEFPFTLNPSSWPPHENRFYVNHGDGTFTERAEAAGVLGESGRSLCAAWADFDADGWPDLYVANDVSDNALYRNLGDGTFENVSYEAIVADYRGAMGIAVGDWDGDLDLDMFITHWIAQENALYSNLAQDLADDTGDAPLMFVDDADRIGLGQIALDLIGWGTAFEDFDDDGQPDLFVANGSTFQNRRDPSQLVAMDPHLYWNRGPEDGFFEVGAAAGIRTSPAGVGRGAAFADYDDDGDVDIVISRNRGRARLLRNDSTRGHHLAIRLKATTGHPSGIGARLLIHAGGRTQLREATPVPSYLSQSVTDLHVGLGTATRADSVVVTWANGARDVYLDLAADRHWTLTEGGGPRESPHRGSAPVEAATANPALRSDISTALGREDTRRFWELKRKANALVLDGRWEEGAAVLREMLALDPHHDDSLYGLGNCYLHLRHYAQAKDAWERLLLANPASSRAWIQIGALHSSPDAGELFDLGRAVQAFQEAHRINQEESGSLIRWGEAELARGRLTEAARVFADAYGMNDQATSAFFLAGYVAWKQGDEDRARTLLDRARGTLRRAPASPAVLEGETRSATMAGYQQEAAERRLFSEVVGQLRHEADGRDLSATFADVDRIVDQFTR
ncbi:MAG: hypothetical protein DHS20C21_16880 [Gemmatimonadota bacterium]|nr:MAG: hypothetical protein DHS20C21_16880 [Gemmatimonadota bacterium]